MIETKIIDYLNGKLSVPVSGDREPTLPPGEYVLVERTGGGETNHIRRATIAVQSYADSMLRAASLMEEIVDEMLNIIMLDSISSVELDTYYNFTDTESKKYRYQGVFDLVYYPEMTKE